MSDLYSKMFIQGLKEFDLNKIKKVPKADLHNHFVLGGNRNYIKKKTGININPINKVLNSMQEMHDWNSKYIGQKFNSIEMRKLLIEATFYQAKEDGIKILEIGEDVWGLAEYFENDIDKLINAFKEANKKIAPDIELRLQIGLSRHCNIEYLEGCLDYFWGRKEFYSIDIYGDELSQPIENFKGIYKRAKNYGIRLKAHVGEWGSAEDIIKAVETLELDEIQHGISASHSQKVINYLLDNKIRLNIVPTSNIMLGRISDFKEHPIKEFYRAGLDVTVNSDDILIFDSDVSKEYLKLYKNKVLTAEELDEIRLNGLKSVGNNKRKI